MEALLPFVKEFGVLGAVTGFLVYQLVIRDRAMGARMAELENKLLLIVEQNTTAITKLTVLIENLDKKKE